MSIASPQNHVSLFFSKAKEVPYFPATYLAAASLGCLLSRNIIPHFEAQLALLCSPIAFAACLLPITCSAVGASPKIVATALHVAAFVVTRVFINAIIDLPRRLHYLGFKQAGSKDPTFFSDPRTMKYCSGKHGDKNNPLTAEAVVNGISYHFRCKEPSELTRCENTLEKLGFTPVSNEEFIVKEAGLQYDPNSDVASFVDVSKLTEGTVYIGEIETKPDPDDDDSDSQTFYYIQIVLNGDLFRWISDNKDDILSGKEVFEDKNFPLVEDKNE